MKIYVSEHTNLLGRYIKFYKISLYREVGNMSWVTSSDYDVAKHLEMDLIKYRKLCENYGGNLQCEVYESALKDMIFENTENAEKLLEELQPYILMRKLKEE